MSASAGEVAIKQDGDQTGRGWIGDYEMRDVQHARITGRIERRIRDLLSPRLPYSANQCKSV
jgi:hypothetical protein